MRVAAAILAITALSFFIFPGHTYLQQDTQIYVPILEHQWTGALAGDLLVERPHVNFTFYDELTNATRWVTHAPLQPILEGLQLIFRVFGFLGIYFIALSLGLDSAGALVVTAISALGATIFAPAVLTIEYEPTPRAFAIPLLLLGTGLLLQGRSWLAGVAAAGAFVLHAPATWPFLLVLLALVVVRQRASVAFIPLAVGVAALLIVGFTQPVGEPQQFLAPIPPEQESLQRMRAAYNYVSTWWAEWTGQYLLFAALAFLGLWRIRATRDHWIVLGGLVALGLMSVPVSWLLLDYQKLSVIPQIQPARALLFVTAIAVLVSGAAGCLAANAKRWIEASAWFFFALWVPVDSTFFGWHGWRVALVVLAFALLLAASRHWMRVGVALLLAPAMAIPAGVVTHRNVETPDLAALADWARSATPSNAIFAFPDSVRDRSPGWFRSRALRPVFVDWKSGGQVNYLREFGYEWWRRWQAIMEEPKPLPQYRTFGIDFVVTRRRLNGSTPPAYSNPHFFAYRVPTP